MTTPTSRIRVSQHVGSIRGGTVIGVQNLVTAPQLEPPAPELVIAYLKSIEAPGDNEGDPVLQRFFQADFHVLEQTPPRELSEVLQDAWNAESPDQAAPGVVLLADSGSGKTLALRKLCKRVASESLQKWVAFAKGSVAPDAPQQHWPPKAPIPLLLNLADLHAGTSLLSLARICFNGKARSQVQDGQIEQLLPACIIFLDGYDEIPPGGNPELVQLFIREHSKTRFVVTTRPTADYQRLGAMRVLTLLDLTDDQVRQIMGQERWRPINESMRQLARNRSLLRMILKWQDTRAIWNKGQLVRAWIADKMQQIEIEADRELIEGVLGSLAVTLQREHTYRCDDKKVMEVIVAYLEEWHEGRSWREVATMLRSKQLNLLRRSDDGLWAFRDRLTQAYFVAAAITNQRAVLAEVKEQISNPWWFESWEILVGLCADPMALMFDLIDCDPVAAARCLIYSGVPLTPNLAEALFDALQERRRFGRSVDRARVVECLGWFDHPKTRPELMAAVLEEPYSSVVLMGVRQYCQLVLKDAAPLPTEEETTAKIRQPQIELAMAGLFDLWRRYDALPAQREQIVLQLIGLLSGDGAKKQISGVAAIFLGFIGSDQARDALLAEFRRADLKEFRAWCVTDALGQTPHPATEQAALEVLHDAAYQGDEHVHQRARAVYLLGWMQPSPAARDALTKALREGSPQLSRRAAQSLGRWQASWSRELLEEQLKREQDEKVIDKIVQALGPVGIPATLPLLESSLRRVLRAATRRHIRDAMEMIRARHA